ncbi:MAG: insulinase family protein, partial [Planctomycetes bacterium]|nr:insulinase family protein [Planctomycetota bacterium]
VELAAAPGSEQPQRYAADVLTTILGDSSGSRLYWDLVDTGEAEHAGLYYGDYQGAGVFWTSLSCDPDRAAANLQKVLDIYHEAEEKGFTPKELEQARSKTKSRLVLSGERPRSRLFNVGGNWLQRAEYRSVQDDIAAIDAVTLEEVNNVLRQYPLTTNTTVTVGPLEEVQAPENRH